MTSQTDIYAKAEEHKLSKYYRFQSRIYDLTRWSFLFGRQRLIQSLPIGREERIRVLEVGCGTGRNLTQLARRYPHAEITGIDLSADMLAIARKKITPFGGRVTTVHGAFGEVPFKENFDLIVFSYCLTMVNPGWDRLLHIAANSLQPGGLIAVVDFHDSALPAFKRHMQGHHVRMDGQLLPVLNDLFPGQETRVRKAYLGLWRWVLFVGLGQEISS